MQIDPINSNLKVLRVGNFSELYTGIFETIPSRIYWADTPITYAKFTRLPVVAENFSISHVDIDPRHGNDPVGVYAVSKAQFCMLAWVNGGVDLYYDLIRTPVEFVESFKTAISEFIEDSEKEKSFVQFILSSANGLQLHKREITPEPLPELETNYGSVLVKKDEAIRKFLSGDKSGLLLFHGFQGTGKTSYIRHLIACLPDVVFTYFPSKLGISLGTPDMLKFFLTNPIDVLIIEDAEELVKERSSSSSAVADLLNYTDGLLGDITNMKIICTFNAEYTELDKALVRRKRLFAEHVFRPLTAAEANKWAEVNGKVLKTPFETEQTLADLYSLDEECLREEAVVKKVGF